VRQAFRVAAALGAVALLAAGCAKPSSSSSTGSGSGGTTAKFTGCMVTDTGGINDKSFNQSSWAGMQAAAAANPNITVKYLPSTTTSDYAKNISTFISQKCGVIVTVGFLMGPSTQAAALANPKQKFAIVDCSYASFCLSTKPHPPIAHNITQLVYNTVQDAFLGGYLAAGMTKTGKVATFGGEKFGTVTIYMDGFWDGVQYYNQQHHKNVQVLGWSEPSQNGTFAGSFTNITAGQTITNTFITHGADIIFPVAGAVGLGAAKAVQTAATSGKNVSMYWVDTDGCVSAAPYCKYFITSVEKGISESVKAAVLLAAKGHSGGSYIGTLANGGAVLAPYHDWASKIPAKLQAEVAAVKAAIISGKIVPATKSPV
jgi:basic membrane protein A and related proteins